MRLILLLTDSQLTWYASFPNYNTIPSWNDTVSQDLPMFPQAMDMQSYTISDPYIIEASQLPAANVNDFLGLIMLIFEIFIPSHSGVIPYI